MPQYLSTDPNAGAADALEKPRLMASHEPSAGTPAYLSTDPNDGEEAEKPEVASDPRARVGNAVSDFVVGAGKELAEQGIRGGALLRKIPGVGLLDHLMAPVEVDTRPSNAAQRAGGATLNVAEALAPGRAVASLGMKAVPQMLAQGAVGAGTAALQGESPGLGAAASMAPTPLLAGAAKVGPAIARNAPAVTKGLTALAGLGAGVASVMTGAATYFGGRAGGSALRSPAAVKAVGNLIGRTGASPMAQQMAGPSANAFRAALLQALQDEEPRR